MNEKKRVALIGWNPEVVDYSKWPDLNPEKLTAALEADKNKLNERGYEAKLLFIDDADSAYDVVRHSLVEESYDCVLVGCRCSYSTRAFHCF